MNDETIFGIGKRPAPGTYVVAEQSSLDAMAAETMGGIAWSNEIPFKDGEKGVPAALDVAALTNKLADAEEREKRLNDQLVREAQHSGKMEARVRVLTAERDSARELADQADGYLRRAEIAERSLADMTTDRDALREIVERKNGRIAATEIERDTARDIAALFREALEEARRQLEYLDGRWPTGTTPAIVAQIDAALATVKPERPRCRVVTSPRFYGKPELRAAVDTISARFADRVLDTGEDVLGLVEGIAEALGMRRA